MCGSTTVAFGVRHLEEMTGLHKTTIARMLTYLTDGPVPLLDQVHVGRRKHAVEEAFTQHPDAEIITSFPGVGPLVGARILAELGDDRTRFADARGLKAYADRRPSPGPAEAPFTS